MLRHARRAAAWPGGSAVTSRLSTPVMAVGVATAPPPPWVLRTSLTAPAPTASSRGTTGGSETATGSAAFCFLPRAAVARRGPPAPTTPRLLLSALRARFRCRPEAAFDLPPAADALRCGFLRLLGATMCAGTAFTSSPKWRLSFAITSFSFSNSSYLRCIRKNNGRLRPPRALSGASASLAADRLTEGNRTPTAAAPGLLPSSPRSGTCAGCAARADGG
mmetsp:Transcript_60903/g.175477  ORF Transcript_60903/g.175477 Transcript_60903/m.175477 type:complete len:220 (-) Transcript_60903:784-1443(-)